MGVKIIHCADFHFDSPFTNFPTCESERRREDLRETFSHMISIAKKQNIDLILISGDLFDGQKVTQTTIDFLINKFNEIPNIKIFISPGNHDPYDTKSIYKTIEWPNNVLIFKNNLKRIDIDELNVSIYGLGFSKRHEKENLISNFKIEDNTRINIMVLHGDLVSYGGESNYNPINLNNIKESKLDYLALGHQHQYSTIKLEGRTYWAYSGNPEGRAFDEMGAKGIIIGEINKNYIDLKFKKINKRDYIEQEINIENINTYEQITEKVMATIKEDLNDKNLYRFILTGNIQEDFILHTDIIKDKIIDNFYYLEIIDKTKIKIDYQTLKNEKSLKGIFVRKMLEKTENTYDELKKESYQKALDIGIKALNNKELIIN